MMQDNDPRILWNRYIKAFDAIAKEQDKKQQLVLQHLEYIEFRLQRIEKQLSALAEDGEVDT